MSKYLLIWQMDPARIPADPKERGTGWSILMSLIKKDFEKGITKDWGAFVGEGRGYCIVEGNDVEISILLQQYSPYVHFETHPVMSVNQINEMLASLSR
jgi:hypothetical protein